MNCTAEVARPSFFSRMRWKLQSGKYWLRSLLTQKALNLIVWLNGDSNYIAHCRREVPEWFEDDGPNRWIADGTVELLAVLSHHGHSGGSIGFGLDFFAKMGRFKPWGPLTGAESEWVELCGEDGIQQNIRASHVFRRADGSAYDINGRVFREPDGMAFTSGDSVVEIEFPYTPAVEYVDVPKRGEE